METEFKLVTEMYNYRSAEYVPNPDLSTDEAARQYIPQYQAAQGIYTCHRQLGKSIPEAMIEVLTSVVKAQQGGTP